MTWAADALGIDDLPGVIPIFPLPGVLLLPRSQLPLHIFEPRYRAMTRDAMADKKLIGMIQPRPGEADGEAPSVYATGCLGVIDDCKETEDGRYNLVLRGVCRFQVGAELPLLHGYRRVVADYMPHRADLDSPRPSMVDRARLMRALTAFLTVQGLAADWDTIKGAPDEQLVNGLAIGCPLAPGEKQALLECRDIRERCHVLTALFEMGALGGANDDPQAGTTPVRH
ncbi:MAG: peptidase S16 [Alphaproteobacteria bacterium]|nr:peptidase S16 [Alphaproteobacteria bacterium]